MSQPPRDDSRGRASRREASHLSSGIDLGHEPPLNASGGAASEVDKWEVNLRWLGASILTGFTGAALIGASIYIALEGATTSALPPERAAVGTRVRLRTGTRSGPRTSPARPTGSTCRITRPPPVRASRLR